MIFMIVPEKSIILFHLQHTLEETKFNSNAMKQSINFPKCYYFFFSFNRCVLHAKSIFNLINWFQFRFCSHLPIFYFIEKKKITFCSLTTTKIFFWMSERKNFIIEEKKKYGSKSSRWNGYRASLILETGNFWKYRKLLINNSMWTCFIEIRGL